MGQSLLVFLKRLALGAWNARASFREGPRRLEKPARYQTRQLTTCNKDLAGKRRALRFTCTVGPRGHARVERDLDFILKPRVSTEGRPCKWQDKLHTSTHDYRASCRSIVDRSISARHPVAVTKQEIREAVWSLMREEGVARFPGARGRIPNFTGAEQCRVPVSELEVWKTARFIKANPDSPQRAIRHLALKEGKTVYVAVPRLRDEKCFVELDPARLGRNLYAASSIKGSFEFGRQISVTEMKRVDLILCGSVAVRRDGMRLGKGGGYSDLEYAIAIELGIISRETPIITTVHPLQIVSGRVALEPHDIPVDFIVTPEKAIATRTRLARPRGIYWDYLDDAKIESIPLLKKMRASLDAKRSL